LKRASMRFWLYASGFLFICGALFAQKSSPDKSPSVSRVDELTLARPRPERDTRRQAKLNDNYLEQQPGDESSFVLHEVCYGNDLFVETDSKGVIKTIGHADDGSNRLTECLWKDDAKQPERPGTSRRLIVGDPTAKVEQLYGEPHSRSPSTKDAQTLELLYYAFDGAGPDVPQVREVVCTAPKNGAPGHVMGITLAAGSL
jgi:hypothetical protein